jgi:hypothetical protein
VAAQRAASVDGTEFDANAVSHQSQSTALAATEQSACARDHAALERERKLGADQRRWIDMISQELAKLPR